MGAMSTAVIPLAILPHVICRVINELHFTFIAQKHYFVWAFKIYKITFCTLILAHMMTSMDVIIVQY